MKKKGPKVAELPAIHATSTYRVRVGGQLGPGWADRVGSMQIVVRRDETYGLVTDLVGTVEDQAALQGLLDQLYARGHVLLSVKLLEKPDSSGTPATSVHDGTNGTNGNTPTGVT